MNKYNKSIKIFYCCSKCGKCDYTIKSPNSIGKFDYEYQKGKEIVSCNSCKEEICLNEIDDVAYGYDICLSCWRHSRRWKKFNNDEYKVKKSVEEDLERKKQNLPQLVDTWEFHGNGNHLEPYDYINFRSRENKNFVDWVVKNFIPIDHGCPDWDLIE